MYEMAGELVMTNRCIVKKIPVVVICDRDCDKGYERYMQDLDTFNVIQDFKKVCLSES